MELAFQFGNGCREQQLDGIRISDAEFPVVGCVKFDQVYRAVLLKISVVRQVLPSIFVL